MLRIYGASKLTHAVMWRRLGSEWPEFEWTARWPYHPITFDRDPYAAQESLSADQLRRTWEEIERDVCRADVVLLYAEPDDVLRGALVEVGMALGQSKAVVAVGENSGLSTWQNHPRVSCIPEMKMARMILAGMAVQKDRGGGSRPPKHPRHPVQGFAQAVRHGSPEHQQWLSDAADAWIEGVPLPAPRG